MSEPVHSKYKTYQTLYPDQPTETPQPISVIANRADCKLSRQTLQAKRHVAGFPEPASGAGTPQDPWLYWPSEVIAWINRHILERDKRWTGGGRGPGRKNGGKNGGKSKTTNRTTVPDFTDPAKALRQMISGYEKEITRLQSEIDRLDDNVSRAKTALEALTGENGGRA